MARQKTKQKQKTKKQKRKDKKKSRRKKDVTVNMPFIVAYQADPTIHVRCAMKNYQGYFELIPRSKRARKKNSGLKGFNFLHQYQKHFIEFLGCTDAELQGFTGLVHINEAT